MQRLLVLLALLLPTNSFAEAIDLKSRALPFVLRAPEQTEVGGLRYMAGYALSSSHEDFGGLSGILQQDDQSDLLLLTDRGRLVRTQAEFDSFGRLSGFNEEADLTPLELEPDINPRRLVNKDAEALAKGQDGWLAVAFERFDRVRQYGPDGASRTLPQPVALRTSRWNGIEALTELPGNRLLALSEGIKRGGGLRAWLYDKGAWSLLVYRSKPDFSPTGATLSPDGRTVFITERRFISYLAGFEARVVSLPVSVIKPDAVLRPRLVADFPFGSSARANIEGIYARALEDGKTSLLLVTDNNFYSFLLPNLLLQFEYRPDQLPNDPSLPPKPAPKPLSLEASL